MKQCSPSTTWAAVTRGGVAICGRNSTARTIGPATSCGKKATNRAKSVKRSHRRDFAAVDVERVADALERVEADAQRQDDVSGPGGAVQPTRPQAFSTTNRVYLNAARNPRLASDAGR